MLYEVVPTFTGEYVDVILARGHINETTNCTNYKSFKDCHIKNLDEMVISETVISSVTLVHR